MSSLQTLCREAHEHAGDGRHDDAIRRFQAAMDLFIDQRSTEPSSVEAYVDAAGGLCECLYRKRDLDACFRAAREAIGIYPVIPRAYGAIGMCIVDRLVQQEAAAAAEGGDDASAHPPPTGEKVRSDPRRYSVKLSGVLCSVDEAHVYLCRAILLAGGGGSLQVQLGPYLETAVRLISEQFISASHALERECGDDLLDRLCPPEEHGSDGPVFLSIAPAAVQATVRSIDPPNASLRNAGSGAATVGPISSAIPREEAQAILAQAEQQQQMQAEAAAAAAAAAAGEGEELHSNNGLPAGARPIDYSLSGRPTAVRVCHGERGGLPRGLTVARAERPLALAAWVIPQPARSSNGHGAGTAGSTPPPMYADPMTGVVAAESATLHGGAPTAEGMAQLMEAAFRAGGGMGHSGPPTVYCAECGREVKLSMLAGGMATGCDDCGGVVYCSADCQAAHRPRHEVYECQLRRTLQAIVTRTASLAAEEDAGGGDDGPSPPSSSDAEEETPGSAWTARHFLCQVLPLVVAVYGGMRAKRRGHELLRAQLARGVQPALVAAVPVAVVEAIGELAAVVEDHEGGEMFGLVERNGDPITAATLLLRLALLVRLYQCPPPIHSADDPDRADFPFSFFYAERLFFRHSCSPNCVWVSAMRSVVTSRYVFKGEELTLAVESNEGSGGAAPTEAFPQHWPWQIRRKWLIRHHGFACGCWRCTRESESLIAARGDLSNELTEQLLTGDRLRRPREAGTGGKGGDANAAVAYPTHHFHRRVLKTIADSRRRVGSGSGGDVRAALDALDEAAAQASEHLLPTHYLLEELRAAFLRIAGLHSSSEAEVGRWRAEGRASLLFYEAMWPGAVPAKAALMGRMPPPADGGARRRVHHRQMRNRRRPGSATAGAATTGGSGRHPLFANVVTPTAAEAAAVPEAVHGDGLVENQPSGGELSDIAPQRRNRPPPRPAKDFTEGTPIDHFYGSYQAWYT